MSIDESIAAAVEMALVPHLQRIEKMIVALNRGKVPGEDEELLDRSELAEMLSVSIRSLIDVYSRPGFPRPIKMGGRKLLWRKADIEQFVRVGGFRR